jgi:hypothetical protein
MDQEEETRLYDEAMQARHNPAPEGPVEAPDGSGQAKIPNESSTKAEQPTKALALYEQMARTWTMALPDLMLLVNPPPDRPVTPADAARLRAASMLYGVPIPGFNLIPVKKSGGHTLYINSQGIQFKLATDPRGIKSVIPECTHMPDLEKPQDYIEIKATITLRDGTMAEDYGISEWPAQGRDADMRLGDLKMKLITKAIRRASYRLVGLTLPLLDEDFYAFTRGEGKEIVDAEYHVLPPAKPKKSKPTGLNELLSMAIEVNPELVAPKLMELMDVTNITDLDVDATWKKIQEEYSGLDEEDS